MTDPIAGWYPDPGGSGGRRYWTGSKWTDHVAPAAPPTRPAGFKPTEAGLGDDRFATQGTTPMPSAEPPPSVDPPPPSSPLEPPPLEQPPPPPGWVSAVPTTTWSRQPQPPPGALPPGQAPVPGGAPVTIQGKPTLGPDGQVLSGWWRRFFGYMIDAILIGFVSYAIVIGVGLATGSFGSLFNEGKLDEWIRRAEKDPGWTPTPEDLREVLGPGVVTLILTLIGVSLVLNLLNGVLLVARSGQTVGDRVVKNRKVTQGRGIPGIGQAFLRWVIPTILSLAQLLQVVGLLAFLVWIVDYLWPIPDKSNQTLHDKAAKTYVERSDLAPPPIR